MFVKFSADCRFAKLKLVFFCQLVVDPRVKKQLCVIYYFFTTKLFEIPTKAEWMAFQTH
jgi:hypothetical protein